MSDTIQDESPRDYPIEKKVAMWRVRLGRCHVVRDEASIVGLINAKGLSPVRLKRYYLLRKRLSDHWRPYGECWWPYRNSAFVYKSIYVRQILDILSGLSYNDGYRVFIPRPGYVGPLLIQSGRNIGLVAPRERDDRKIIYRRKGAPKEAT